MDFPFIVKMRVFEIRSRAVDLFGYILQDSPLPVYVLQMLRSVKAEIFRNLRSRFFSAVLSCSLYTCHMFSQIHSSVRSIKKPLTFSFLFAIVIVKF
jgi:hypothetical protein